MGSDYVVDAGKGEPALKAMTYKDYIGSAEVSVEDGVLHGRLLGIRDLVTYEADTPAGLEAAYREAVDDYLADCAEEERKPDKPFKGSLNVRIGRPAPAGGHGSLRAPHVAERPSRAQVANGQRCTERTGDRGFRARKR